MSKREVAYSEGKLLPHGEGALATLTASYHGHHHPVQDLHILLEGLMMPVLLSKTTKHK